MSLGTVVQGAVYKLKKRIKLAFDRQPKLDEKYGALPENHVRFTQCKKAFESGLEKIASDEEFCRNVATGSSLVWWPRLGPLTADERLAVYHRVQQFALDRLRRLDS